MPVYLYACEKCKDNKELVKGLKEKAFIAQEDSSV